MKTNLWKLSCMALAMTAITAGCTQNEELGTPAPSNDGDVLNVVATANDFVSSDPTSRVSETNYTTTFEEGDAIGVFVVRDGEAVVSNMKMTLDADGTTWAGENGAKLYYYKGADYIAYSPYTEGLSVTKESEIVDYFTEKLQGSTGQSTLAEYQAADLMTASVAAVDVTRGLNITFNFAHKMSMIEIKVPIRAYTTTGGYKYSAPLGLKVTMAEASTTGKEFSLCTFGTTGDAGSEVTKGIYRCIVAPSETTLNVEGEFQDGSVPVYFPAVGGTALSVTPEAGKYKGIDVNYTYQNYTATRDLQVGDYYYADGSICPGDMENIPSNGCVGIIYSTTVPDDAEADGYSNAMVLALHDLEGKMNWANNVTSTSLTKQYATTSGTNDQALTDLFADKHGYTYMKEIKSKVDFENYPAFYSVANSLNGLADISSLSTSGWYIPTIGQMADIINAFSTLSGSTYVFGTNTAWNVAGIDGPTIMAMLELYNRLEKVGGTWNIDKPDMSGNTDMSLRWWTSSEHSATNAFSIDMNCKKFVVLAREKNTAGSNNLYVRPVFAF